jgi:hypothetical protein
VTGARVIETVARVTPLGVRFWDPVARVTVSEGLLVRHPKAGTSTPARAAANHSGIFALAQLPRLRFAEQGDGTADYWRAPPAHVTVSVFVDDLRGRFHSFGFDAHAPEFGLLQPVCGSPPSLPSPPTAAPGVPLFSTPSRVAPAGVAVIRAELRDGVTGGPAAWARVEVRASTGGGVGVGIADRRGVVAVFLLLPPLDRRLGSPPGSGALSNEHWTITLDGFYRALPDPDARPHLCHFLHQPAAQLLTSLSPPVPLAPQTLRYGRDLVVRPVLHLYPAA